MAANFQQLPLEMVRGNQYGRYPKISLEEKFNLIVSDGFFVPHAGHKKVGTFSTQQLGRTLYVSTKENIMIGVAGNEVFTVSNTLTINKLGTIETFNGDVFIAENDNSQIAICDRKDIWIYNYSTSTFAKAVITWTPNHIEFQDGYFIATVARTNEWRLSALGDGTNWPTIGIGGFATKPNNAIATVKMPGLGNLLFVLGQTVTEGWTDVGLQLFPYQKSTSYNVDYGIANPSTLASGDKFVVWLGINEKAGAVIMYSTGGDIQQISNDGINFKLARLKDPYNSFGFLYKQDGHLFYHLTFADPEDNFTLLYDFNTQMFFSLTDEYGSAHIAKKVVFFNNSYYFVSTKDGLLYELNSNYTTYDGVEIPRTIVTKQIRLPDQSNFIANDVSFTIEQGDSSDNPRIDLTASRDGGISFGNVMSLNLNAYNNRKNKFIFRNLGMANDLTLQFRFWGLGKFVFSDGILNIYQ